MSTCNQFTTAQLKGLTYKLQCCMGDVAKKYARYRAVGRYDLALCKEYDLKYLTLAYNALNCIEGFDTTVSISTAYGNGKTIKFTTASNHGFGIRQFVDVLGFSNPIYNVVGSPILAIPSANTFIVAGDITTVGGDPAATNPTVKATINNLLSCDDIQAILDKTKSICDCDCCQEAGESLYNLTYNSITGQLTATAQ